MIRVVLTLALGYVAALHLPGWLGLDSKWGVAGLTGSAGIAAWLEFYLLRRAMNARIGVTGVPSRSVIALWVAALLAAAPALAIKLAMGLAHPVYLAAVTLPVFAAAYLFVTSRAGIPEAAEFRSRVARVIRRAN
jgi:putative peptidoglycan lipid II flippase